MVRNETHQAYIVGPLVKMRFSGWTLAALGIAGLFVVPILSVLSSFMTPASEVWRHLWRTQLVELIMNTVLLLAGVGSGTLVVGTGLAWLVVYHRFPGRAFFEWALILPLAIPAYVLGFVFLGLFDFAGPLQTLLRATFGQGFRLPTLRSYGGVTLMMTLVFYPYVYLLARAACLAVLGPCFLLPVGQLGLWTLQTLQIGQLAPAFGTLLLNTLYLAGLATGLACLMAVVLAYASRLHPSPSIQWSTQCAALG